MSCILHHRVHLILAYSWAKSAILVAVKCREGMFLFLLFLLLEDNDLPNCTGFLNYKNPYKQIYIAGSATCSTKPLSHILTWILTAVKEGLQKYFDTAYARSGVTQMWILKNSKELLENLKAQSLHSVNSIKSSDFSTLYTTIPHDKLKSKLKEIINQFFFHKNGNRRILYVVIGYKDTYFVRDHSDALQKKKKKKKKLRCRCHKDAGIFNRKYFVEFGGRIFKQIIGIPMGTICAPLLADLFLYSYEAEFYKVYSKQSRNTLHNNSISPTDIKMMYCL